MKKVRLSNCKAKKGREREDVEVRGGVMNVSCQYFTIEMKLNIE